MKKTSVVISLIQLIVGFQTQARQVSQYEVGTLCSYPYSCDRETIARDNRPQKYVEQKANATPVKGQCMTFPSGSDYLARSIKLECGTGEVVKQRLPFPFTQEQLDNQYYGLQKGNREEAQQAMRVNEVWQTSVKIPMQESWVYKKHVGDYIDCSGRLGADGGEEEIYNTTCYREGRTERVVQRVVRKVKYCAEANPPPKSSNTSGGSYNYGGSSSDDHSSGGSGSSRSNSDSSVEKGYREDYESNKKSMERGWEDGAHFEFKTDKVRSPARYSSLRRIQDDIRTEQESEPMYGCARWETRKERDEDVELDVDVEEISYSCTKTRNKWCTWYQDEVVTATCPEAKTVTVTGQYVTPKDWNPKNTQYDDQLPNKSDLLLGESELIRVRLNEQLSSSIVPSIKIVNGVKNREKNWNEYDVWAQPQTLSCEYKDQALRFLIQAKSRNLQAAPNILQFPKDENGQIQVINGFDENGRPAILSIINPGRQNVLNRSEISRAFGQEPEVKQKKNMISSWFDQSKPKQTGGINKKFWEDTRFWIRMFWADKKTKVYVTQSKQFNINQASPVGDMLEVRLDGKMGMEKFYKLAVPYEKVFGWLGTDVSLDPNRQYYVEMKIAQPNFDGIYESGLKDNSLSSEEQKKLAAFSFSESVYIPVKAPEAKNSLLDKFWHWRSQMMKRPGQNNFQQ